MLLLLFEIESKGRNANWVEIINKLILIIQLSYVCRWNFYEHANFQYF